MHHYYLKECDSTQSSFKEFWAKRDAQQTELLVSADNQHKGVGRRNSSWLSAKNGISMSCSLPAQSKITLSPLAVATFLCQFFKIQGIDLRLKWPNDLLNSEGQKVGGILCQTLDQDRILVGIGLNLLLTKDERLELKSTPYPVGDLDHQIKDKKKFAEEIYKFLLRQSIFSIEEWNSYCIHLRKLVSITDGETVLKGQFIGIDHDGAAILEIDSRPHRVLTGSLRIS
tara:strand:- start:8119 stop:8802 length:684 start_codon:yes stop_codon:yes gene_type:complete